MKVSPFTRQLDDTSNGRELLANADPVRRRKLQHDRERLTADEVASLFERILDVLRRGEAEPRAGARISVRDEDFSSPPPGGGAGMPGVDWVGTVESETPLVIGDELRPSCEVRLEALVNGFWLSLEPKHLFVELLVGQMRAAVELRLQRVGENHRATAAQKRLADKKIRDVSERHLRGENGVLRGVDRGRADIRQPEQQHIRLLVHPDLVLPVEGIEHAGLNHLRRTGKHGNRPVARLE